MLHMGYLIILDGQSIKKISFRNSIAFGKSTSQRSYSKQRQPLPWETPPPPHPIPKWGEKHVNTA